MPANKSTVAPSRKGRVPFNDTAAVAASHHVTAPPPEPDLENARARARREISRRCGISLLGEAATDGATIGELLAGAMLGGDSSAGPVGGSLRAIEVELELLAEAVRAIDQVGHLGPVVRGLQRRIEVIAEVSDRIMLAAIAVAADACEVRS